MSSDPISGKNQGRNRAGSVYVTLKRFRGVPARRAYVIKLSKTEIAGTPLMSKNLIRNSEVGRKKMLPTSSHGISCCSQDCKMPIG